MLKLRDHDPSVTPARNLKLEMDSSSSILSTESRPTGLESSGGLTGSGRSKSRKGKVQFSSQGVPDRQESLTSSLNGRNSGRSGDGSETSEHTVVDVETPGEVHFHSSSDEECAKATPGPDYSWERSPFIDPASIFGDSSGRTFSNQDHERDEEEPHQSDVEQPAGGGGGRERRRRKKSRENAPEQRITIFALRLALIEKGASGLGTLSFLWATVVILGGFATTVNETDFWVVTLIILAESSRIFSRSHELEWQQLSVRSHESLAHRFLRAASSSYQHNVTFARAVRSKLKSFGQCRPGQEGGNGLADTTATPGSGARAASNAPRVSAKRRSSRRSTAERPAHKIRVEDSNLKDQTRTWNAPSVQLLPHTHDLVTTKLISRLLYAVQLLSAVMSIGLAIWRLLNQDFFYNPGTTQSKPPNIVVSMNVFYILSVVEAGMFLIERFYWEYRIRVTELLQKVNKEAELGPENLLTVKQFFYDVYSQCLKGSVFDGLEMDLVSFSISWLQAEDFRQQLAGARLLNRIVSHDDGKPRKDHFAADCLRRLGTTPGILERLVEMLSWNSKQEEPLLTEVAVIICRLVVYNRNCSRIVAIPGSIEGIINLLLPHDLPSPEDKNNYPKQAKAYLELRVNGLRILKYLCKDHKNCLRIGETKGLLSVLILFIEVRSGKVFEGSSEKSFFVYQLKTYKKSLQVIGLLAAAISTSGGILRRRIADVVSGLKNLRDMIELGDSQPELQRLSVEILFHLAMEPDVRKTMGATGGIIRNLYNLLASYDDVTARDTHLEDPDESKKRGAELHLASEMAGKTLARIVLQNEKNCLKVISMESEHYEPFLKCMFRFLAKPLETNNAAPREIASCSAQILRTVMFCADDRLKQQVAEESAGVVLQLIKMRLHEGKSSLYESYLGLASRILDPLDHETYSRLFGTIISKHDLVQQILRNLKHTPSTNRYPKIRRYSIELLIVLSSKDDSFLNIFRSKNVDLIKELRLTLDSITEVENFCLFSGLVGYTRHHEEMEEVVVRAIQHIEFIELSKKPDHPEK